MVATVFASATSTSSSLELPLVIAAWSVRCSASTNVLKKLQRTAVPNEERSQHHDQHWPTGS